MNVFSRPLVLAMVAAAGPAMGEVPFQVFTAPDGKKVEVACLKHASVAVRYDGLEIHVDPVGKGVAPATDYREFPKADLILVTHEHFDHFDREAIAALRKEGTGIFANPAVQGMLGEGTALANGEKAEWRGVTIEAVPAYNTSPERLRFHPKGRDNGYVVSLGGFRVYVAGDTEDVPEMAGLRGIDLAFLPCNLPYTMTPEQTVAAARSFGPKVLVPYHYGETRIGRVAELLEGSGIEVRIPGGSGR